jgi:hypothetical protein
MSRRELPGITSLHLELKTPTQALVDETSFSTGAKQWTGTGPFCLFSKACLLHTWTLIYRLAPGRTRRGCLDDDLPWDERSSSRALSPDVASASTSPERSWMSPWPDLGKLWLISRLDYPWSAAITEGLHHRTWVIQADAKLRHSHPTNHPGPVDLGGASLCIPPDGNAPSLFFSPPTGLSHSRPNQARLGEVSLVLGITVVDPSCITGCCRVACSYQSLQHRCYHVTSGPRRPTMNSTGCLLLLPMFSYPE